MPAIAKAPQTSDVSASTPVKLPVSAIAQEGSHAAAAVEADNAQGEAKVDIHALLSNPDVATRDNAATELVNLVKLEGPQGEWCT